MANLAISHEIENVYCFLSTIIIEVVTPKRGKTTFSFNTEHNLLTVLDADDTNPHRRKNRFSEYRLPESTNFQDITLQQLWDSCSMFPFAASKRNSRYYAHDFKHRINKGCVSAYHRMLQSIDFKKVDRTMRANKEKNKAVLHL